MGGNGRVCAAEGRGGHGVMSLRCFFVVSRAWSRCSVG